MGDLAQDMVDGLSCTLCGAYFEEEHGHPVVCEYCYDNLSETEKEDYILATHDEL